MDQSDLHEQVEATFGGSDYVEGPKDEPVGIMGGSVMRSLFRQNGKFWWIRAAVEALFVIMLLITIVCLASDNKCPDWVVTVLILSAVGYVGYEGYEIVTRNDLSA